MNIVKITTLQGKQFFSDQHGSPELMAQLMKRCDWVKIERIDMLAKEYKELPATQDAAQLFRKETAP